MAQGALSFDEKLRWWPSEGLLFFHIETILPTPNYWQNLLRHILACKQIGPCCPWNHEMWVKVSIVFAYIRGDLSIYVGAPLIGPIHLSIDEQAQSSNEGYDGE